jgi:hypothetical protein
VRELVSSRWHAGRVGQCYGSYAQSDCVVVDKPGAMTQRQNEVKATRGQRSAGQAWPEQSAYRCRDSWRRNSTTTLQVGDASIINTYEDHVWDYRLLLSSWSHQEIPLAEMPSRH